MRIALALVLVAAACGDGDKKPAGMPDSGMEPMIDAMIDGSVEEVTFTSYVIDMISNGTTQARPYAEFAMLPDLDLANPTAYQSLF